ncbi:MAG: PorT family protein [Alistipes sp.]|nr:PorT family protein [Alistipes sp.]
MKRFIKIVTFVFIFSVVAVAESSAQHTIAVTGGSGFATARPYPDQVMKPIWGTYQVGFSWRYYSMPRFIACFGIDVELLQRGFSFAPYPYKYETKKEYRYYTRTLNSIMIPIVWQPHFYLFKKHLRVYLEAAPTFSFNFASKFHNDEKHSININGTVDAPISGKYEFRTERDNRFSYGLRGGAGFDLIFGQFEFGVRAMYDFGYSDILRNRNKYYSNNLDSITKPGENPFYYTPLRSPLDNLTISVKLGFRIGKAGFKEWEWKRPPFPKNKEVFKYTF